MQKSDNDLGRRFRELSERAETCRSLFYSDFLTLAEQQVLFSVLSEREFYLLGGYEEAERKLAVFGADSLEEAEESEPFYILEIAPKAQKFADALTHRDFLGSLLALGIKREMLGDIVLSDNIAYVFVKPKIAGFIEENLERVRHTSVKLRRIEALPSSAAQTPEEEVLLASSARLDALLASAFHLSRKDAQSLVVSGKVFLNGREILKNDTVIADGTIVSARGQGRFKLLEQIGTTKKGKCRFAVLLYR